ncbi:MAG TPA: sulfotransferase, partial [Methylomirabilota bacterium]|nr:sulfotransferase [Methylomirabilota bacterium]
MSLSEKTFILGVGAQKAGTTWLHQYLDEHPEVFMSPIKELHYFDEKHCAELAPMTTQRFRKRLAAVTAKDKVRPAMVRALSARIAMKSDDKAYERYFEERVKPQHRAFGEITPSYSLLPVEGFRDAKSRFE